MTSNSNKSTFADGCRRIVKAHGLDHLKLRIDQGKFESRTKEAMAFWRRAWIAKNWQKCVMGAMTVIGTITGVVSCAWGG